MNEFFKKLLREEHGQDLGEYALLFALIALVVIGAVTALGASINGVFDQMANSFGAA